MPLRNLIANFSLHLSSIISNGRRNFPADIEHLLEGYEGTLESMAFSLPPSAEGELYSLVLLVEVKDSFVGNKTEEDKAGEPAPAA